MLRFKTWEKIRRIAALDAACVTALAAIAAARCALGA